MIGVMTLRKQQKSLLELEKPASYDETILVMQVTYRPYKRACTFLLSIFVIRHRCYCFILDTCANQLMSTFRLKCFIAYVHIDIVVKYA
jgi:hypothetical protein